MAEHKTIHRYPVVVSDRVPISMDEGAEILSVAPARDGDGYSELELWATAYPGEKVGWRELVIVGTGNPVPPRPLRFIGTCVMPRGLVWHVFEAAR